MFWSLFILFCLLAAVGLWMLRGVVGRRSWRRRVERAAEALRKSRPELEQQFFAIAAASGLPRGLAWKSCDFGDQALLARDRNTNDIYALVRVTIAFEAIAGGEMEHVEAVGNLRCATALFEWKENAWTTKGRVMFNLEPRETIDRYRQQLEAIGDAEEII